MKKLKLKNRFFKILFIFSILFSFLVDYAHFSIGIKNIIPIRIFVPAFVVIVFLFYFRTIKISEILKDKILFFLGCFVLLHWISIFWSMDKFMAFGLGAFWFIIGLFYFTLKILYKKSVITYKLLPHILVIITVFLCLVSYLKLVLFKYQNYIGFYPQEIYRPGSLILDTNHFGYFLVMTFFITYFSSFLKNRNKFIFYYFLLFSVLASTWSFSAWGSLIIAVLFTNILIFIYLYKFQFKSTNFTTFFSHAVLFLFFFTVGLSVFPDQNFTKSSLKEPFIAKILSLNKSTGDVSLKDTNNKLLIDINVSSPVYNSEYIDLKERIDYSEFALIEPHIIGEASIKAHLALIYSGVKIGLQYPLIGVGAGSFDEAMVKHGLNNLFARYDPGVAGIGEYPGHGMYTQTFAELGFVGLFIYMGLLISIFFKLLNNLKNAKEENTRKICISFIGVFISYCVFTVFYNLHEEFFWIPLLVGVAASSNEKDE